MKVRIELMSVAVVADIAPAVVTVDSRVLAELEAIKKKHERRNEAKRNYYYRNREKQLAYFKARYMNDPEHKERVKRTAAEFYKKQRASTSSKTCCGFVRPTT